MNVGTHAFKGPGGRRFPQGVRAGCVAPGLNGHEFVVHDFVNVELARPWIALKTRDAARPCFGNNHIAISFLREIMVVAVNDKIAFSLCTHVEKSLPIVEVTPTFAGRPDDLKQMVMQGDDFKPALNLGKRERSCQCLDLSRPEAPGGYKPRSRLRRIEANDGDVPDKTDKWP